MDSAHRRRLLAENLESRLLLTGAQDEFTQDVISAEESGFSVFDEPIQVAEGVWHVADGPSPEELALRISHNNNAADTTNADQTWSGGGLGLSLDGTGVTVGVWDSGRVRNTHQEFGSRVSFGDGASSFSSHATHVAGTIGAAGVSANARGMANQSNIVSYDWNSDTSEMAASSVDISNHSYGIIKGWTTQINWGVGSIDTWYENRDLQSVEDTDFGKYGSGARSWDQTLAGKPNLITFSSAGNDRNDSFVNAAGDQTYFTYLSVTQPPGWYRVSTATYPAPGGDGNGGTGFDSIGGDQSSKNSIVVGAIHDITADPYNNGHVTQSSFSGWGPMDDGRLRPDVVGNGVSLFSPTASSNSSYANFSGTSMSSPNVAGSAALLHQHHTTLFSSAISSAAMKALLAHTAFDAGNTGPDYKHGYGVVDTAAAATALTGISNGSSGDFYHNATYSGSEITYTINSAGTEPIKVTMAWTDPAGTAQGSGLDLSTPALVNDLDLTITGPGGTYNPWTLDRDNPNNAAVRTTGNHVDNIEQVVIDTPSAGTYTVRVNHTGSSFTQAFSIFSDGGTTNLPPTVDNNSSALSYTENQGATAVDAGVTVTDAEDLTLAWASVSITGNFMTGQDALAFTDTTQIKGTLSGGGQTMTLTPQTGQPGSVSDFEDALRQVTYVNTSEAPSTLQRTVTFSANDGSSTGSDTRAIDITAVNDAPVLDDSASPTLTDIVKNSTNPPGDSVSDIIVNGSITDPDGTAVEAIAVIGVDGANGSWQYSTGGSFMNFGTPTAATARLLGSTDKVRFVPNTDYVGTSIITLRAWDQSSGTAGSTADTTSNGGITAFSTATDTAQITVNEGQALKIIDDGDADYSEGGSNWGSSSGSSFYDGDTKWNAAGNGGDTATWTATNMQPGRYRVSVTWREAGDQADNAPYTLFDGQNVETSFTLNQKQVPSGPIVNGRPFQSVGEFNIESDNIKVTLTDDANGYVLADAVMFDRIGDLVDELAVAIVADSISENGGSTTATVTRSNGTSGDLVVDLASSDTSEATVPNDVTILDGSDSAQFTITGVDDAISDGTQTVTITASSSGYEDGTDAVDVTDDELASEFIVDDGDADYSKVGSWGRSTGSAFYANDTDWSAAGGGQDKATWTVPSLAPGKYEVQVTWRKGGDQATNAPYTLRDGGDVETTFTMDQTVDPSGPEINGFKFQSAGTFNIQSTSMSLELTDAANGYVLADAARFVRVGDLADELSLVIVADSISENGGSTTATVTRSNGTSGDLVVNLLSSDTSEATVPNDVTILDGASSAQFTITAVDDALSDGTQTVTITASATSYDPGTDDVDVTDDELATEFIVDDGDSNYNKVGSWGRSTGSSFYANDTDWSAAGSGQDKATWTVPSLTPGKYLVQLTWRKGGDQATNAPYTLRDGGDVEATFTMDQTVDPSGPEINGFNFQSAGTFNIQSTSMSLELTDAANGYVLADAARFERIGDLADELSVAIVADSISENGGSTTATVTRSTGTSGDLVVSLTSDDTSEATVPATVTILNGSDSAQFTITAVDDAISDGTQTVTISASATGFETGQDTVDVTDDELPTVFLIDDGDTGYNKTGSWGRSTGSSFYANDTEWSAAGTGADKASWEIPNLTPGKYRIHITWRQAGDQADNAPYTLYDGAGIETTFTVNQKVAPTADMVIGGRPFQDVGTFDINNTSLKLELSDLANGYVLADAVHFERVGDL